MARQFSTLQKTKNKTKNKSKNPFLVLFFLISFSIYTFYCIYHQGSLVRGVGWRTRAEYPFSYNIMLTFGIILPVGTLVKHIIRHNTTDE